MVNAIPSTFDDIAVGLIMHLYPEGYDCSKCRSGYVSIMLTAQSSYECVESSAVQGGLAVVDGGKSIAIENCVNYKGGQWTIQCSVCGSGHSPTKDNLKCVLSIPNCALVASSGTQCDTCQEGFSLGHSDGLCYTQNITNCLVFGKTTVSGQVCEKCSEGYYLSQNTCAQGQIAKCLVYSSEKECSECQAGFSVLDVVNGTSYCYPNPANSTCQEFEVINGDEFSCKTCQPNFLPIKVESAVLKNICLEFNQIQNCVEYDKKPQLSQSALTCSECATFAFLKSGSCASR